MRVEAEIVATGDELMSGAVQDSNTTWLCGRLRDHGVHVRRTTMIGDPQGDIETALREAASRSPVVVVTGGLGPTEDDRTAAAAAAVNGVPLVRDEAALEHIASMFRAFGREMTPNNAKQADFPRGAEVLANPVGTAPGFAVSIGTSRAFFMPGVPREMKKMFDDQVLPRVKTIRDAGGASAALATRVVKSHGLGESKVESELAGIAWPREIAVGYRAKFPEIHLRLYAEGAAEALPVALAKAEEAIRARLGVRVFGVDDETMASVVGTLLVAKGWRMAVAESCTAGLLGASLTEVAGSSAWFDRGWLSYSNEAKVAMLGVPESLLAQHGAVSEQAVSAMAAGARERSGCALALAITGIAGPGGGTPEKPVGTVWIACATEAGIETRPLKLFGDRERIRLGSAWAAMDLARRVLLGVSGGVK